MSSLNRNRDFLRLWAAAAGSAVGAKITRTALPMLAILTIDATPAQIAMLATLSVAPGLVVSLWGGGVIDRRAKRPLLIWADLLRALLILTVPVAALFDSVGMAQLYLVAGAVGAATTLFGIADNTYLPVLLDKDDLIAANARLESTEAVAEGIGPWLGGVLVGMIGAPAALIVDTASYVWSAVLLSRIEKVEPPPVAEDTPPEPGLLRDARAGLRACLSHPLIGRILMVQTLEAFAGGFLFALYMVIVLNLLTLPPATVGLIIGVGGLGSFLGAWLAGPLRRRVGDFGALVLTLAVAKVWGFSVPLAIVWPQAAVPLLVSDQLIGDAFMTAFIVVALSLRQRVLPERTMGRANATFHLAEGLALVAGSLVAGALVTVVPVAQVAWGASVLGLMGVPLMWAVRRRQAVG